MENQYVLVEYRRVDVMEFPTVFVGTAEECRCAMLARFGKICADFQKEPMVSGDVDAQGEHARLQDDNGLWRVEWWIVNANECKGVLQQKEGETK